MSFKVFIYLAYIYNNQYVTYTYTNIQKEIKRPLLPTFIMKAGLCRLQFESGLIVEINLLEFHLLMSVFIFAIQIDNACR